MNYKIGDKVRVKTNLKDFATYGYAGFAPSMRSYCGGIFEIAGLCANFYYLKNCGDWRVSDEMLEPTYTLQECIDKNYAIHCDTEDKANKLMKALDSEGHGWVGNERYSKENNRWRKYGKATCYFPFTGQYCDVDYYKSVGLKIVWFDDVILPQDRKINWCDLYETPLPILRCRNCIYFIGDKPILDEAEKTYLEAVIRPFKDKVCGIIKCTNYEVANSFFIAICIPNNSPMLFPPFHTKMYVGMKLNKPYTLQELGLFGDDK